MRMAQNACPMLMWIRQRRVCRLAIDDEIGNRIQLIAEVESQGSHRRPVAQTGPHVIPQVVQPDVAGVRPDVAAIDEQHAAQFLEQVRAQLDARREHAVPAQRQAGIAERTDLVSAPAAKAGRPAEKVLLRERHVDVAAPRHDIPALQAAGDDQPIAQAQIVAEVYRGRRVRVGSAQRSACLVRYETSSDSHDVRRMDCTPSSAGCRSRRRRSCRSARRWSGRGRAR